MDFDLKRQRAMFDFGAHLGIAFQVHDDILDFTQSAEALGKPAFNDLKEGIITAPIIYALREADELNQNTDHWNEVINRKFQ